LTLSPQQTLYTLQTWFSPSFPVGAYTYSHGLENAFEQGLVTNAEQAVDWIGEIVASGNGFADCVFALLAQKAALAGNKARLSEVAEFATAFSATKELRLESEAQGAAFIEINQNLEANSGIQMLTDIWPGPYTYPVAVGAAAGGLKIKPQALATAYLHGFVSNLASALVRIVPLGQTDGQKIIAQLGMAVELAATNALTTNLDALATSTLMVDLCSMQHEIQYTRLFRS